jgi:hypothetical protein
MSRTWGIVLLVVLLSACRSAAMKSPPPTTAQSPAELAHLIAEDAKKSDQESDAKAREALAADALSKAQACIGLAPGDAGCLYYDGVALGLDARAHPSRALETLKTMLSALQSAEAKDPAYDQAGPSRVRALVLIRAPGWPVGPGDAETGLAAAKRAVMLKPDYPPNVLALAEALAKNGDAHGAQESYQRARDLATVLSSNADRDDWIKQADEGLKRR